MFEELTVDSSLTRIEEEARRFWARHGIAEAALEARRGGAAYRIAQQPLMAGQSFAGRVRLLAHGDLMARYHRMRGEDVCYQIGRVGHGLAVEVAAEQAAGEELLEYDVARFVDTCRALDAQQERRDDEVARRLGVWAAAADAYPRGPGAIPKVWAALHHLWDAHHLRREIGVAPVCPRCATPLSAAEASRQAVEGEGQAAWVMLPWTEPGRRGSASSSYLLVWTPAPWALLGLVAVAARPSAGYVVVEVSRRHDAPPARLVLSEAAWERMAPAERRDGRVVRRLPARALRGARYRPLFTFLPIVEGSGRVVMSDALPDDTGTGLMPVMPAFDAPSLAVALAHHLPISDPTDEAGRLGDAMGLWRGFAPPDAEPFVMDDLQARGLVWRAEDVRRAQPVCPYCATKLAPLARPLWLAGSWIAGRDRAWGVPLPVWACHDCGHAAAVAGLDELSRRAGVDAGQIDPSRPEIDRLGLACERCGGTMRRVRPVLDAHLEAALLPGIGRGGAQSGPVDLAVGLGDRDMGWLGDLGEVAAMLHGRLAWSQAVALPEGDSGDEQDGARRGIASAGDALRWAAYGQARAGDAGEDVPGQAWALACRQAGSAGREPGARAAAARVRLLHGVARVTSALDECDVARAARELGLLVADLAAWPGELPGDTLETLARLMAPFVPHVAEAIYQRAGGGAGPASVHLAAWPGARQSGAE